MNKPKEIKRIENQGLQIKWTDGREAFISNKVLREHCPSAISQMKRGDFSHEKPLSSKPKSLKVIEASLEEELKLEKIWSIGNYAIGMRWADGHDSGIFTFELLERLSFNANN
jgi:ATP-binding protein involved in chromosome partitioning